MTLISRKTLDLLRNPGFWLIVVLFVLITVPHYADAIGHPTFLNVLMSELGLTRNAFERILYLAPIVWAGFMFSFRGAFVASLVALGLMLPRALIFSTGRVDSLFETSAVFIIGNVLAITFDSLKHARERRIELEQAQTELQSSEQRYRSLFEDAHDAIWFQDMDGAIVACNAANARLTGYDKDELIGKNVKEFLSLEALDTARQVRQRLLEKSAGEIYDQRIRRKDGSEAFVRLSSSLIRSNGQPIGFQHIARDITEERRLQENQRHYLEQVTRAQEQERKRISRELHDDTIQSLVVLSRQLDSLATAHAEIAPEFKKRLEDLWQQCNSIMQGVRRLSQDLRPAALDRLGLLPALQMLATDTARFSEIPIRVNVSGTERRLAEEVELVLFRIVQEALRNVWRHSKATAADVMVEFSDSKVRICINDNGNGFDLPATVTDFAKEGKLGLAGMEERARLVGATLSAESHPGKGTKIMIEMAA